MPGDDDGDEVLKGDLLSDRNAAVHRYSGLLLLLVLRTAAGGVILRLCFLLTRVILSTRYQPGHVYNPGCAHPSNPLPTRVEHNPLSNPAVVRGL